MVHVRQSLYSLLEPQKKKGNVVNLLGFFSPLVDDCEMYELLQQVTAAAEQISGENPFATITPTGIRLTLTAVVVIPILCVYPFVQKFYVKGLMVGAVKG